MYSDDVRRFKIPYCMQPNTAFSQSAIKETLIYYSKNDGFLCMNALDSLHIIYQTSIRELHFSPQYSTKAENNLIFMSKYNKDRHLCFVIVF